MLEDQKNFLSSILNIELKIKEGITDFSDEVATINTLLASSDEQLSLMLYESLTQIGNTIILSTKTNFLTLIDALNIPDKEYIKAITELRLSGDSDDYLISLLDNPIIITDSQKSYTLYNNICQKVLLKNDRDLLVKAIAMLERI